MEKNKLIDGMVVPFDCLIGIGGESSPIEGYRRFCEDNNVIDNKQRGFRGVQIIDSTKVLSSMGTSFPYAIPIEAESLEQDEIEQTVWSHAFVHEDSVTLVPFLALNHSPKSIKVSKDIAVRLIFWESQVDKEGEGRHSPMSGLANLHELDRRGK